MYLPYMILHKVLIFKYFFCPKAKIDLFSFLTFFSQYKGSPKAVY